MMNTEQSYAASIAAQYAPLTSRKAIALRKLDRKAKQVSKRITSAAGFVACLLLFASLLIQEINLFLGIVLGIIGLCLISGLPFLYHKLWEKAREQYTWDIVTLAKQVWEEA
ncbi:MAG: hypothetical protein LUC90_03825 [Lachnospiraceae bacterium]|nr:hypothetical protein [Lachnospiraceae bacterium]